MSGAHRPSGLKFPSKIGKSNAAAAPASARNTTAVLEKTHHGDSTFAALASAIFTNDDWPVRKKISDASLVLSENTDDFIIGDRIWIGGTKPGHIQYIGETQFAPGEWAGIVLDEPIGKNDGSVAGVRYFMCESKRGVFSRLTKLSREPIQHLIDEEREAEAAAKAANGSSSGRNSPMLGMSSSQHSQGGKVPLGSLTRRLDSSTSPRGSTQCLSGGERPLKVGARVTVHSTSGSKNGMLRYLGSTEFASGEWGGVELEEPVGKNDGSVAGKRYFTCKTKYGLFAPIHKITTAASGVKRAPASSSRVSPASGMHGRAGSHESLNSSLSSASTAARPTRKTPIRSTTPSVTATHNAMQEALKEKEQHIEQLLKERDLERSDVAKAAVQVDEAERKLSSMKSEHQLQLDDYERRITKLREMAEEAQKQCREYSLQLEEEKRKVEDLQFRVEEESISKSDLERRAQTSRSVTEADAEKIKDLKRALEEERKRADRLEIDSQKLFQAEETIVKLTEEIEQTRSRLSAATVDVKHLEMSKGDFDMQLTHTKAEVTRQEKKISSLESIAEGKTKELSEAKKQLKKLENTLEEKELDRQTLKEKIADFTCKTSSSETAMNSLQQELHSLKLNLSDLQRKLQASEERCEQAMQQKCKLEQDIADLMKGSSSSSQQLTKMNEDLRNKEKSLDEAREKLESSSQQLAQLEEKLTQWQLQSKMDSAQAVEKYEDKLKSLTAQLHTATNELQSSRTTFRHKLEQHESEAEAFLKKKDAEWKELKCELDARDSQIGMLSHQLRDVRKHVQDLAQRNIQETDTLEKQMESLKSERDKAFREKEELELVRRRLEEQNGTLQVQVQQVADEKNVHERTVRERDAKLAALTAEVERLHSEFRCHKLDLQKKLAENQLEEHAMQDMHNQHSMQCKLIEELQNRLCESEKECDRLHELNEKFDNLVTQNKQLEGSNVSLKTQMEEMKQSLHDSESERTSVKEALIAAQSAVKETETELQRREALRLQNEKSTVNASNKAVQLLEQEKLQLANKVIELQVALERTKDTANSTDSMVDVYREEKSAAEAQIEFLNSVIVDMQKKNDDLQSQIQILEAGPTMADDINLNGIKAPVVLPRLFCDICDMFDLHDTEDCPQQASSESPPPTQHHGTRNQVRPYCDICEVFGHWTNQCNDDEMF